MMSDFTTAYLTTSSAEHRQQYGQFFTPSSVAAFMCKWVLSEKPNVIYDPAFGLGSFYFAVKSIQPEISFVGSEVDDQVLQFFRSQTRSDSHLTLEFGDYLLSWGKNKYEAIVCNPPYMRFQKFLNRADVFRAFEINAGLSLSGYTNIASAFLLKSIQELKPNGRLAYIMPIEFLNTGYGTIVKEKLIKHGLLKALIRLEGEKEVFPNAITTTGILLVANNGRSDKVAFYNVRDLAQLEEFANIKPTSLVSREELNPKEKWLRYFDANSLLDVSGLIRVKHYGTFSRGIATGANEFFALTPRKAAQLGVPKPLLSPCITRSAQISSGVFTNRDFQRLVNSDSNIYLLNASSDLPLAVEKYIKHGEQLGYHRRYLTKVRSPWYKLERRKPATILFGVFSRNGFKVIRNYSDAINLTCYHCFYPNLYGTQLVDRFFLYLRSRAAKTILRLSMRQYGDNLDKFEPNDLNQAFAPSPDYLASIPSDLVTESMTRCASSLPLPDQLEHFFERLINPEIIPVPEQ